MQTQSTTRTREQETARPQIYAQPKPPSWPPCFLVYLSTRLLLVVCVVATVLVGCAAEVTPVEPVTITFCFPESQDRSLYQPIAEAFQESHPHITINLRPDPSGQWVRDESHEVDAFVWWSDPALIETRLVLSLDPLLAKTPELPLDDFYPRSLDMFDREGALWALPAEVDMQLLYYNTDLFDESGVAYPQAGWTWDDLC